MATANDWTNEDKENELPNPDSAEMEDEIERKEQPDGDNAKEQRKRGRRAKSTTEIKQHEIDELIRRIRELEHENKLIKKEYDHELTMLLNEKKAHDKEMTVVRKKMLEKDQQLNEETAGFQRRLNDMKEENQSLLEDLTSKSAELVKLRTMLKENENDYNDLLAQMTDQEESNISKPKGLAVVDSITKPLEVLLPSEVEWTVVNLSPSEAEAYIKAQSVPDLILIMTGVEEISSGKPGLTCYTSIKGIIDHALINKCSVVQLQLPPHTYTNQINMFNLKISKTEAQFLRWDTRAAPKSELIAEDGSLLTKCIDLIGSTFKDIKIPEARKKDECVMASATAKQSTTKTDVTCITEIEKSSIGKLIGRGGRTIKQISADYGVKLSIGQWIEAKREFRDELKDLLAGKCDKMTDAVVVDGDLAQVQAALKIINLSLSADQRSEPPAKKHKF